MNAGTDLISLVIALSGAVGLAMLAAHWHPGRRGWGDVPRYCYGVAVIGGAAVLTWFFHQDITSGGLLIVLTLYTGIAGLCTWIGYLLDRATGGESRSVSAEQTIDKIGRDDDGR